MLRCAQVCGWLAVGTHHCSALFVSRWDLRSLLIDGVSDTDLVFHLVNNAAIFPSGLEIFVCCHRRCGYVVHGQCVVGCRIYGL